MANTNPENKVDDSPPQLTGLLLPQTPTPVETRYTKPIPVKLATQSRDETPPPPSRSFSFDYITYFLRDPAETTVVENEGASFQGAGSTFLRMAGAFVSVLVEALMS